MGRSLLRGVASGFERVVTAMSVIAVRAVRQARLPLCGWRPCRRHGCFGRPGPMGRTGRTWRLWVVRLRRQAAGLARPAAEAGGAGVWRELAGCVVPGQGDSCKEMIGCCDRYGRWSKWRKRLGTQGSGGNQRFFVPLLFCAEQGRHPGRNGSARDGPTCNRPACKRSTGRFWPDDCQLESDPLDGRPMDNPWLFAAWRCGAPPCWGMVQE